MKGPLWAVVFLAGPFFLPGLVTADFGAGVIGGIFFVLFSGGQNSKVSRITGDAGGSGLARPKKIKIIIDWIFFGHLILKILYTIFVFFLCSRYLESWLRSYTFFLLRLKLWDE